MSGFGRMTLAPGPLVSSWSFLFSRRVLGFSHGGLLRQWWMRIRASTSGCSRGWRRPRFLFF